MHMPFTGERFVPELRGQIYYEHLHRYALAFGLARDLDVLDIASGEGYGAAYLAVVARTVTGVDNDPQTVRHASARYTAMNLSFRVGSCERIPLADQSIDLAVSFETLEHIDAHEQFMREIVRVLRPNGRLLLSSPNKLVYSDLDDYQNPFHVRELYFDELRKLLADWFPHVQLFGQRVVAASAVHPLRGVERDARCIAPTTRDKEWGLPALPAPAYFVAVCSRADAEPELAPLVSIFVDPSDDLLAHLVPPPVPAAPALDEQRVLRLAPAASVAEGQASASTALSPVPDRHEHLLRELERSEATCAGLFEQAASLDRRNADLELDRCAALAVAAAQRADLAKAERRLRSATDAEKSAIARIASLEAEVAAERQRAVESDAARQASDAENDTLTERVLRLTERTHELAEGERIARAALDAVSEQADALQLAGGRAAQQLAVESERARTLGHRVARVEAESERLDLRCRSLVSRNVSLESVVADGIARQRADAAHAAHLARALDEAQAELVAAGAQLAQTRAYLDDVVGSRSWRMTRPIRVALRSLRGD